MATEVKSLSAISPPRKSFPFAVVPPFSWIVQQSTLPVLKRPRMMVWQILKAKLLRSVTAIVRVTRKICVSSEIRIGCHYHWLFCFLLTSLDRETLYMYASFTLPQWGPLDSQNHCLLHTKDSARLLLISGQAVLQECNNFVLSKVGCTYCDIRLHL